MDQLMRVWAIDMFLERHGRFVSSPLVLQVAKLAETQWTDCEIDTSDFVGFAGIPNTPLYLAWNPSGSAVVIDGVSGETTRISLNFHEKHLLSVRCMVENGDLLIASYRVGTHKTRVLHRICVDTRGAHPTVQMRRLRVATCKDEKLIVARESGIPITIYDDKITNGARKHVCVPRAEGWRVVGKKGGVAIVYDFGRVVLKPWVYT